MNNAFQYNHSTKLAQDSLLLSLRPKSDSASRWQISVVDPPSSQYTVIKPSQYSYPYNSSIPEIPITESLATLLAVLSTLASFVF